MKALAIAVSLLCGCGSYDRFDEYLPLKVEEYSYEKEAAEKYFGISFDDAVVIKVENPCDRDVVACVQVEEARIMLSAKKVTDDLQFCVSMIHEYGHIGFQRTQNNADLDHEHYEYFLEYMGEICRNKP